MSLLHNYLRMKWNHRPKTPTKNVILENFNFGIRLRKICKNLNINEVELKEILCEFALRELAIVEVNKFVEKLVDSSTLDNLNDAKYDFFTMLFMENIEDDEKEINEYDPLNNLLNETDKKKLRQRFIDYHYSSFLKHFLLNDPDYKFIINSNKSHSPVNVQLSLMNLLHDYLLNKSFIIDGITYINKYRGLAKIITDLLLQYNIGKNHNKTHFLITLLESYMNDDIDKYDVLNQIDTLNNTIIFEYIKAHSEFLPKDNHMNSTLHQIITLLTYIPDIELKLFISSQVIRLFSENNLDSQKLDKIKSSFIQLYLYIDCFVNTIVNTKFVRNDYYPILDIEHSNYKFHTLVIRYLKDVNKLNKNYINNPYLKKMKDFLADSPYDQEPVTTLMRKFIYYSLFVQLEHDKIENDDNTEAQLLTSFPLSKNINLLILQLKSLIFHDVFQPKFSEYRTKQPAHNYELYNLDIPDSKVDSVFKFRSEQNLYSDSNDNYSTSSYIKEVQSNFQDLTEDEILFFDSLFLT